MCGFLQVTVLCQDILNEVGIVGVFPPPPFLVSDFQTLDVRVSANAPLKRGFGLDPATTTC